VTLGTDSRRLIHVVTGVFGAKGNDSSTYEWNAWADVSLNAISSLELTLSPLVGGERRLRLYDCQDENGGFCSPASEQRDYLFADLEGRFLSLTLRATWTFSPHLTLQTYAQLFMATREFSGYRDISTGGGHPTFGPDDMTHVPFAGDFDGDGIKDDDAQDVELNVNVVLRWELLPGSTLIGVVSRGQVGVHDVAGQKPRLRPQGLGRGPTEDLILLKLVYFWG
jgi:hypothetical protein